jgi:4-hydroxyphenylacetate 3-monooxygenase
MPARDGTAYLAGLRDERQVWIAGERVADVTTDPRLGRGAHAIAALYDLQSHPELRAGLTYTSPTSGEQVGLSFIQPRSVDDLVRRREMFQQWANLSGGMVGRSPDYLNALLMGCAANRDYFARGGDEYGQRIVAYYERCREQDLCLTHAFVTPQRDRGGQPGDREPTSLSIVEERADGILVTGAQILATLAPFADELLILPSPSRSFLGEFSPQALALAVRLASPGLKIICRESFDLGRSAFDHPLGSRFEEQDAVVVFDQVLVPWERVFIRGDTALCGGLFRETNAFTHAIHQFLAKNLAKAELLLGIATLITQTIRTDQHPHVQGMLGEMVDAVETIWAFIRTAEVEAKTDQNGICVPRPDTLYTARNYFPRVYPRLVELLEMLGSSGLMAIPDEATVESEIADDVETYYQSATLGGKERVRLFRLAWDVACSSFGARQVLYERFFAGDPARNQASRYQNYDKTRAVELARRLMQREGVRASSGQRGV